MSTKPETWKKRGVVKQILKDHFHGFWELHADLFPEQLREDIQSTVRKAIRCGTQDMGYARYECLGCREGEPEPVLICFTCKSRFCHGCGKKYTDEWAEKQQERILNVPHRHTVFTVPKELRKVFFADRKKLNELSQKVAQVIQHYYRRKNKSKRYEVGVIAVIHTFGRDLKFNPHIHALVTEGALDNTKQWKRVDYISFNYLGRYLARPAIAEYRIVSYDYHNVHYWYEDHQTGKRVDVKAPVYRFLYDLIQHIPPKHFRRMIETYDRDPIQCPCCKNRMELVVIWHGQYGRIYYYNEEWERNQEKRWGAKAYEQRKKRKEQGRSTKAG